MSYAQIDTLLRYLQGAQPVKRIREGKIVLFYYEASEVDFFDRIPLLLVLKIVPDYIMGLNLHYIPRDYRLMFLTKLNKNPSFTEDDIQEAWEESNIPTRFIRNAFKKYKINNNIKSKIRVFDKSDFHNVLSMTIPDYDERQEVEVVKYMDKFFVNRKGGI